MTNENNNLIILSIMVAKKFLDITETQINSVFFSQIHGEAHHEFNKWAPFTMNVKWVSIILRTLVTPKNCSYQPT